MTLESKFIKDTDNQYSIRNDGVIISHKSNKSVALVITNGMISLYVNKQKRSLSVLRLVEDYFNIRLCGKCKEVIKDKKYNANQVVCNTCHNREPSKKYRFNVEWKKKNYESCIISKRKSSLKSTSNITRHYAAMQLEIPTALLTEDLYNLYKTMLQLKRLINTKNNVKYNSNITNS